MLPGRNATMGNLVSLLQRAILDSPVVYKTGLSGRYDFELEWAPDETQFGGHSKLKLEGPQRPDLTCYPFFELTHAPDSVGA